jgi:hypothetical protein
MRLSSLTLLLCLYAGFMGCERPSVSNPATSSIKEETTSSPTLPSQAITTESATVNPSGLASWLPESSMESLLAAPEVSEGVSIRPPTGYIGMVPPGAPPGVFVKGWKGALRPDNSSPSIQLNVFSPPATNTIPDAETAMRKMLDGIKRNRNNWTESEVSRGTIQGIEFLRKTWTGESKPGGIKMRGVMYLAKQDDKVFQVSSQDVEPHAEEALKLAESSLRTFAKAPQ